MKKLLSFLTLSVISVILIPLNASALSSAHFELTSVECKPNRVFTVELSAYGSGKLSAVLFDFTYDRELIEFRTARTDADSYVVFNEKSDRITLSYLNENGIDLSSAPVLLTLEFKSLKEGTGRLNLTAYDCVDSDVSSVKSLSCTPADISVSADAPELVEASGKSKQSSLISGGTAKKNNGKSGSADKSGVSESDVQNSTLNENEHELRQMATLGEAQRENKPVVLIVLSFCASAVLLMIIGFIIGKVLSDRKNKNKNSADDPSRGGGNL